ncbi:MAG: Crp/Fnr family transcriptional regulator [Saprospiraceae bacterium]
MKTMTETSIFQEVQLFQSLTTVEINELQRSACMLKLPKNSSLYEVGAPSSHLYILVKGSIKIGAFSSDGREVLKAISHPISVFGELGLVGETTRREFARTINEETQLVSVPISEVQKLMERNSALGMSVLDHIGSRLLQIERRMESLIFQDARTRIIQFLKDSAAKRGRRVGFEWLFKHSLTQQDIANITGTSRQTVTSVLNELRKENLIHFNRKSILIRDLARLS